MVDTEPAQPERLAQEAQPRKLEATLHEVRAYIAQLRETDQGELATRLEASLDTAFATPTSSEKASDAQPRQS